VPSQEKNLHLRVMVRELERFPRPVLRNRGTEDAKGISQLEEAEVGMGMASTPGGSGVLNKNRDDAESKPSISLDLPLSDENGSKPDLKRPRSLGPKRFATK